MMSLPLPTAQDSAETLPDQLSPDMAALIARILAEEGPAIDTTTLPAQEGRALTIEANRRWNLDLPTGFSAREVIVPADPVAGSAATRALVHAPANPAGTIVFVHGGGFAFCSPETHQRTAMVMAEAAGMAVVLPDYRLAPENPFPAGLHDVIGLRRALRATPGLFGLAPGPVVLAGDSAGANLALASLIDDTGAAVPETMGAVLFYGVYTADFHTPSYRRFHDGPGLTTPRMQRFWDWYLPDSAGREDPRAAPIHTPDAVLKRLPPLVLTAAGIDPLLSDTLLLAERLRQIGREDPLWIEPGVIHGYLQRSLMLEAARRTLVEAGKAARAMLST